jgi:hypothetical protein
MTCGPTPSNIARLIFLEEFLGWIFIFRRVVSRRIKKGETGDEVV